MLELFNISTWFITHQRLPSGLRLLKPALNFYKRDDRLIINTRLRSCFDIPVSSLLGL